MSTLHPEPIARRLLPWLGQVAESPVWDAAEQALYWVNIPAGELHRWRARDGRHEQWRFPQALACIARLRSGGWLGAMADGIYALLPNAAGQGAMRPLAQVRHARSNMRFNDGRCDRQGRFWVGSMRVGGSAEDAVGVLYQLRHAAGQARLDAVFDGFLTPNGLAFSPDGRTMYASDSFPTRGCVWAFDYDPDAGVATRRRPFIPALPAGRPDGAAVDAAGCYWISGNGAGKIYRYTPAGKLDRTLSVPVAKPSMCAFGGPGLKTLFVTSIRLPGTPAEALDGSVFALEAGVQGLPEPAYADLAG